MHNGDIAQFLDTGWFTESTIWYKDYIYWCEGSTDFDTGRCHFWIYKWRADMDEEYYFHSYKKADGDYLDYETAYDIRGNSMEELKARFLEDKIFDGKSFQEAEKDMYWLDEGEDIIIDNVTIHSKSY